MRIEGRLMDILFLGSKWRGKEVRKKGLDTGEKGKESGYMYIELHTACTS